MEGLAEKRDQQGGGRATFWSNSREDREGNSGCGRQVTGKGERGQPAEKTVHLRGSLQAGEGSDHMEASRAQTASSSSALPLSSLISGRGGWQVAHRPSVPDRMGDTTSKVPGQELGRPPDKPDQT